MRIVFLSVDDEFAGAMQRHVFECMSEAVIGSVISKNAIYRKNSLQAGIFVLRKSGPVFLLEMFRMKILRKIFDRTSKDLPSALARRHGVPIFYSGNINSAHDIAQLRAWQPDLVISTNFSHYIGKGARSVARHGTWNLHKALLPMYRGMAPSFHALRDGSEMVGCTLHVVTRGFDTGDIIRQVEVPVRPDDTVYSLNRKTSDAGGRMLAELLVALDLNRIQATPQPAGDWKEHTYPSPSEVRDFRQKRLRF